MNLIRRTGVVVLSVVGAVGLVLGGLYIHKSRERLNPTSSIELTNDELPETTAAAQHGDSKAAAKLSRHFLSKKEYRLAYTWMVRAKQLGDPDAESDLNEMRKFLPADAMRGNTEAPTP